MPKIHTIYRGGNRFYVHPEQHNVTHPGVTSVLSMVPKPFLTPWAAKLTAELAVDSIDFVAGMAARDRAGAVEYLKGASRRYTKIRSDIGSAAHDLFERMIRGERIYSVHPDLEPYRNHFAEFLAAVNPELYRAEDVAWSDTHEYAGSFDIIMRVWLDEDGLPTPDRTGRPHLVMADWKTSKDTYPEVALQMAAYRYADEIRDADGNVHPMPEIDGAAVLHITDTQWALKPVRADREVFAEFLNLRRTFRWVHETSKTVIGKPIASSKGRIVTGTQRRAR